MELKEFQSQLEYAQKNYQTVLTVKCAWCGKFMHFKDGLGVSGTSDTICEDCLEKVITGGK